jgi:putative serine protease PepD
VQTLPPSAAASFGTVPGVAVVTVKGGTGAANAGLKPSTGTKSAAGRSYPTGGDVITAIDGSAVTTAERLRAVVDQHVPGDKLTLTVRRGSARRTVVVTLGSR